MKAKYRIIVGSSTSYPYYVEKKGKYWFSMWHEIDRSSTPEGAEVKLREYIRANVPPEGTIIKQYDDTDMVVELLKNGPG